MRGCAQIVAHSTNGTRARRGARVGGGQRDAAREPGDHRAVAPGGGEPRDAALRRPQRPGTGSSPSASAPPPWRTSPPISANTTSSRSCSAANAPTRNGGAWLVTNRTGRRSPQRLLVGGDRRPPQRRPRERALDGRARRARRARAARPASSSSARSSAASASGSPGATSRIPPPRAAISSGPGSPRQPIAGTPPAIAST